VLIQRLPHTNFSLPFFSKQKFAFAFFSFRMFEAFETAQQQSSSRLIKGFLRPFSFLKLLWG
jgi:hypothetical protein